MDNTKDVGKVLQETIKLVNNKIKTLSEEESEYINICQQVYYAPEFNSLFDSN